MAAHSSVLAWRIPGTGEPGGLPSMKRLSSSSSSNETWISLNNNGTIERHCSPGPEVPLTADSCYVSF